MLSVSDFMLYFGYGLKDASGVWIGTGPEQFIYYKSVLSLVPYSGDVSINSIFEDFIKDGWTPVKEKENIIALTKDRASIPLEPGGQFELSGAPLKTIPETCKEINNPLAFTKKLEEKYQFGFLGLGFFPIGELKDVPMVPKKRYSEIMTPYMKSLSKLGLEMMYQSATVRPNFDYISESR
jgi:Gamma-glutamylcysteine synthetase